MTTADLILGRIESRLNGKLVVIDVRHTNLGDAGTIRVLDADDLTAVREVSFVFLHGSFTFSARTAGAKDDEYLAGYNWGIRRDLAELRKISPNRFDHLKASPVEVIDTVVEYLLS